MPSPESSSKGCLKAASIFPGFRCLSHGELRFDSSPDPVRVVKPVSKSQRLTLGCGDAGCVSQNRDTPEILLFAVVARPRPDCC